MPKRVRRVPYVLDAGGIGTLSHPEVVAILRAADSLIMSGGRSLLAKVLKGSRDKKVLELGLNENPAYGYYSHLTLEQIRARVDWTIQQRFLAIKYDYRLPLLIYTDR